MANSRSIANHTLSNWISGETYRINSMVSASLIMKVNRPLIAFRKFTKSSIMIMHMIQGAFSAGAQNKQIERI